MKPIGNWKVTAELTDEAMDLGIHSGHIIDIARKLSGIPCYNLFFVFVTQDEDNDLIPPPEKEVVRFLIDKIPREVLRAHPEIRQAWIQSFLMQEAPAQDNWLVVTTLPFIKMEFL